MPRVWTMGEMLVEIMRPDRDTPLGVPGRFLGPYPSGAPAIFIDTVARLGMSAGIVGGVGRDAFGDCLIERLRRDGVDTSRVRRPARGSTAVAFVAYASDGSRTFIFHIDGTPAVTEPDESFDDREARLFHVMGCSLMADERFRHAIEDRVRHFRNRGVRIAFDPNIRTELLGDRSFLDIADPILRHASYLFPGDAELRRLGGTGEPEEAATRLFDRYPLEAIVVKQGSRGATVYTRDRSFEIAPYPVVEVDPTGAGDCFDAGFVVGLLEGRSLEECGRIASAAGALNAAAFGPMEGNISRETVDGLAGLGVG